MRVLNDQQQRSLRGGVAQKIERGQGDEEEVRSSCVGHPEGRFERLALRTRKIAGTGKNRSKNLVEAGKGETCL
jgi:hypothetical protein